MIEDNRVFKLNSDEIELLFKAIMEYPKNAEKKINKYLHGHGYERMEKSIHNAIPVSERKKKHAKNANPLKDKDPTANLAVTITTKTKYRYLYFPDDGTNTLHHAGERYFFQDSMERETDNVVSELLDAIRFEDN